MNTVKDIDRGWDRIKRELGHNRGKAHVAVGILAKDAARTTGDAAYIDNPTLGAIHEFGSSDGHIPERSFIRATVDANVDKYRRLMSRLLSRVVMGYLEDRKVLSILGARIRADIVNRINAGIEPKLADSTADKKGSSKPLIDTGNLKRSINYEVRGV